MMEKISVLIVEDQSLVAEVIATKLKAHGMQIAGIYSNGEDAINSLESNIPDLILMDILLAGVLDGIDTALRINESFNIPIIYLSDHVDERTLARAKKTLPASYLSKPFNEGDLVRSIEIAFTNWRARDRQGRNILKDHVFIKENQSYIKLSYNDIVYLEADRAYCNVVTEQKTYIQTNNMSRIFDQINHKDFIRIHRSYVINVNKITEIEGNIVRLGNFKVEMSKGMRDELMSKLRFI